VNFLVVFALNFLEWPLAVMERLRRESPAVRFHGLVYKETPRGVIERIHASGLVEDVLDLTRAEMAWLSRAAAAEDLREWDARLGPGVLNRILLGDALLARTYAFAHAPWSALARAARSDDAKRAYLCGLLAELDGYLERREIGCVFTAFSDSAPHLALAELCRVRGLQFLRLTNARVGTRYVIDDDPRGRLATVERRYRAARVNPGIVAHTLPEARAFLAEFRRRPWTPQYLQRHRGAALRHVKVHRFLWRTLKLPVTAWRWRQVTSPRVPRPLEKWTAQLRQVVRARIGQRQWVSDVAREVPGRFAFFPLHLEPEASTRVMAPTLPNQLAVIETLTKSLPLDMTLLVKEHPTMFGRRPRRFYQTISRFPRCRLVDPRIPGIELVGKAAITCTISSTAAWEAMLLGRPALALERFPFAGLGEGLVECTDFVELPDALARALSQPPAAQRSLELYLAAIFDLGFDIPPEFLWGRVTRETVRAHPEIVEAMSSAILRAFQREEPSATAPGTVGGMGRA
jgi:hypothetical protein